MTIELLYFDGCPSWKDALTNLKVVLGNKVDVTLIAVETDEDAVTHQFVGSPTIRKDGHDLFPVNHTDYALGCRVYVTPNGMKGSPTVEMIQQAIDGETSITPDRLL